MTAAMTGLTAEDRTMLADSIARFVSHEYRFEDRQRLLAEAATGRSAAWRAIAELGLLALLIPQELDGLGGSLADAGVVMTAFGRNLVVEPYLSTAIIAAPLLTDLDPHKLDLSQLAAGGKIVALASQEPQLGYARGPIATSAALAGNGWFLSGEKSAVLDGPIADVLLVTASDADGRTGLFAVNAADAASGMRARTTVDGRTVADVRLVDTPALRIGEGDVGHAIDRAYDRAAIALGFEAMGSMKFLVDATSEHIRTRKAFGGTLSQFQVLRHRLVDMFIAAEEVRAITEAAAAAYGANSRGSGPGVSAMKVCLCRSARAVAEGAVQLHGGMGMTEELAVSHHFKRLMTVEALFGDTEYHLDRYITLTNGASA